MRRRIFLTTMAWIGALVGLLALGAPATLLASKGVDPAPATLVWVRETGVLILVASATLAQVRREPDSVAMRAVLWANALLHLGLLPVELLAWRTGVIPRFGGIAANTVLHALASAAFVQLALRVDVTATPSHKDARAASAAAGE